jgi:hypothetical protein
MRQDEESFAAFCDTSSGRQRRDSMELNQYQHEHQRESSKQNKKRVRAEEYPFEWRFPGFLLR